MSSTSTLPLRILYTVNSSPQYILARSHSLIPVFPVTNTTHYDRLETTVQSIEQPSVYATVSLRTCLDVIRRSSPELVGDNSRDFSVYVLDPLESNSAPAPVHMTDSQFCSSTSTTQANKLNAVRQWGVAVGLGLLSQALLAHECDGMTVNGTLVTLGRGQQSLEVIFSLRESAVYRPSSQESHPRPQSQDVVPFRGNVLQHRSPTCANANPRYSSGHASTSFFSLSGSALHSSSALTSSSTHSSRNLPVIPSHILSRMRSKHPKPKKKSIRPPSEAERLLDASVQYLGPPKRKWRSSTIVDGIDVGVDNRKSENEHKSRVFTHMVPSASDLGHSDAKDKDVVTTETCDSESSTEFGSDHGLNAKVGIANSVNVADSSVTTTTPLSTDEVANSKKKPNFPDADQLNSSPTSNPICSNANVESGGLTLLDIVAAVSSFTSPTNPSAQNATLLAALNLVDSAIADSGSSSVTDMNTAGETSMNPVLADVLRQLLSACSKQAPPPLDNGQPVPCQPTPVGSSQSQDEDIVLLDKESVNPTAFRRRAQREKMGSKLLGAAPSSNASSFDQDNVAGQTYRSSENAFSTISHRPSSTSSISKTNEGRKRRLVDVMDERESGREYQHNKENVGWQDAHRHLRRNSSDTGKGSKYRSHSLNDKRIRYHRPGMDPLTSQKRDNEKSGQHPIPVPETPGTRLSVSSPTRSSFVKCQSRKRYVVPEWARTDTTTQPRLSKEAESAIAEAEKRKKEEKAGGRKRSPATSLAKETGRGKGRGSGHGGRVDGQQPGHQKHDKRGSLSIIPPLLPVAASSDFPVLGMFRVPPSTLLGSPCSSETKSRSPSRSSSLSTTNLSHAIHPPSTPEGEGSSLFTPTPKSWSERRRDEFDSAARTRMAGPNFGLPLPNHQTSKLLPIQPGLLGETIVSADSGWGDRGRAVRSGRIKQGVVDRPEESVEGDTEYMPTRELDNEPEEPDSLPTASSDIDIDTDPSYRSWGGTSQDLQDENQYGYCQTMTQHWSGLPPSSPPPPSSPLPDTDPGLRTNDAKMDDMDSDLPLATSDAEYGYFDSEATLDVEVASYSAYDLATNCNFNDCSTPSHHDGPSSGLNIFEEFTNHQLHSDDSHTWNTEVLDQELLPILQNGLVDFDFTKLWESMGPLMEDNMLSDLGPDVRMNSQGSEMLGADDLHCTRLAEDVHALFGGCLT